jgi:hypothetical protein
LPRAPQRRGAAAFLAFIASAGCTSSHILRPLGRGNGVVHASLGGPMHLGIPLPVLSVGGGYGVKDDLDLFAHADLSALAFGVVHVDHGFALHPLIRERGWVPTLTLGASLHLMTNFRSARAIPQLTLGAAWRIRTRHLVYVGSDLGLSMGEVFYALFAPFLGGELRVGKRVGLSLEAKWIAPQYDTTFAVPYWSAPGNQGAFSIVLGLNVYLGGVR